MSLTHITVNGNQDYSDHIVCAMYMCIGGYY